MATAPGQDRSQMVHVTLVRERGKGGGPAKLWVKEPESQVEDKSLLSARLCSCSDVCLAVVEER